ncbi:hypothetical protein DICA2_E10374 [Diutina catenulata]
MLLFFIIFLSSCCLAHLIPRSIGHDPPVMASVYDDLTDVETDFINDHLKKLKSGDKSPCDACIDSIKYAKELLQNEPSHNHLVSLLMYKYCLDRNNNDPFQCDSRQFFISTNAERFDRFDGEATSGTTVVSAVDFYDNDFLRVLSLLNTSSQYDLQSFCYHQSMVCELPKVPKSAIDKFLSSLWPAKEKKHESEPDYGKSNGTFNVLDFTDTHIQLRYKVGSEANCTNQLLCCLPEAYNKDVPGTKDYNFSTPLQKWAGTSQSSKWQWSFYPDAFYDREGNLQWGDYYDYPKHRGYDFTSVPAFSFGGYNCDPPELLLNSSLKGMAALHQDKKFEFAISQGDYVDHDEHHCTPNATKYAELHSFDLFKYYLKNITVLPTLGNHDSWPYAQMAPRKYNYFNGYEYSMGEIAQWWINEGWFPQSQFEWLRTHYSGFVYETKRGLKVINMNSNCYYAANLWNYIDQSVNFDPYDQWKWVIEELVASEKKGQRVWIQAHVPPGSYDSLAIQQYIFNSVIDRFSPYTVAATFFGHTHRDQIKLFYKTGSNKTDSDVTNVAWIAQSVTPAALNNPGFRYFEVDSKSFNIMNSYNYFARLNETYVARSEPKWELGYTARETYDPGHTWPASAPLNATFWNKYVVSKLKSDIGVNQKYIKNQYRDSPYVPQCANNSEVSTKCRDENWCLINNVLLEDYIKCVVAKRGY